MLAVVGLVALLALVAVLTYLGGAAVGGVGRAAPFFLMTALFLLLGFLFAPFWIAMVLGPIGWALLNPIPEKPVRWDRLRHRPPPPSAAEREAGRRRADELHRRNRCHGCGARTREGDDRCPVCGSWLRLP